MHYDLGVFIGRFQPFHNGHLAVIRAALAQCRYLLIVIGSADQPRRWDVLPFTDVERMRMIQDSLTAEERGRVDFAAQPDSNYSDDDWTVSIQQCAEGALDHFDLPENAWISLVGHSKDQSSYYIKMFPQWDTIEVPNHEQLDATAIREIVLARDVRRSTVGWIGTPISQQVPVAVQDFLLKFQDTDAFAELRAEREFMLKYLKTNTAQYPPNFVTSDAVVIQAGHVLLVQRRDYPCKGLWALPGGHVEKNDTFYQTVIKELMEETRIAVPEPILKKALKHQEVFDHPMRSTRKRTITTAFLFHLQPEVPPQRVGETTAQFQKRVREMTALPKIKAGSDAKRAVWVPLADVQRSQMMEDHYKIIHKMLRHLDGGN